MFGLGKKERQLQERLEGLEASLLSIERKNQESADALSARVSDLRGAANKHDMAIADMLDTWDEWREEARAFHADLSERYQEEARESVRRENALLEAIVELHDQFYALKRAAEQADDRIWKRQLELAEEKMSGKYALADFQILCAKGAPIDYDLHEVISVAATDDRNQAMRVADVYLCGYAYRGQVIRKAKVAAFQWTGPNSAAPEERSQTAQSKLQGEEESPYGRDDWH